MVVLWYLDALYPGLGMAWRICAFLSESPGSVRRASFLARWMVWGAVSRPCCCRHVCWTRDPGTSGHNWPWVPVLAGLRLESVPARPGGSALEQERHIQPRRLQGRGDFSAVAINQGRGGISGIWPSLGEELLRGWQAGAAENGAGWTVLSRLPRPGSSPPHFGV